MKCIDAIEGTVKYILEQLHMKHAKAGSDDSEYVFHAKTVIEATDRYILKNPELVEAPELLKQVLYVYSRNLWIMGQQPHGAGPPKGNDALDGENEEYQTYYYDYLYDRGVYPN
jgi:hypothetical protein